MGEPVKFEVGQVVRFNGMGAEFLVPAVVVDVGPHAMDCSDVGNPVQIYAMSIHGDGRRAEILSPAPRIGDTWSSGESVARIVACADRFVEGRAIPQLRLVSEGEPFVGDVAAVARRLWEGGYRVAKRAPSLEEMLAKDPIAQALLKQMESEREQRVKEMFPDRSTDDEPAVRFHVSAPYPRFFAECGSFTVELPPLAPGSYTLTMNAEARTATLRDADGALLPGITPIERMRDDGRRVGRDDTPRPDYKWQTVHDDRIGCTRQTRSDPFCDIAGRIERILDSTRVDRATGDDLRKLAELHGVLPGLRAGMVVRDESRGAFGELGAITRVDDAYVYVRWSGGPDEHRVYTDGAMLRIRDGRWRVVTPDVAPLASLANAVAAIFERPDLATSRRYIDIAIATLRSEPFARAIAAALVAASDEPLAPFQIAALVRGARAHERRRSEVAPGLRALTASQLESCWAAAHYESESQWSRRLSEVYERARSL